MSDSDFNPDDMRELDKKFHQIIRDSDRGYCIEIHVTALAAQDMVKEWIKSILGDEKATQNCMQNYSYIMTEMVEELKKDDDQCDKPTDD